MASSRAEARPSLTRSDLQRSCPELTRDAIGGRMHGDELMNTWSFDQRVQHDCIA